MLGITIILGLLLGICSDLQAIAPPYGPAHQQAHDALYDQIPDDINPPPPHQSLSGNESIQVPGLSPLEKLSSRAGFNAGTNDSLERWAGLIGAGWYIDWTVQPRFAFQLPEHWQMIRLGQDGYFPNSEAIKWLAAKYPGNVWIIGNEPDNIWQDNIPPETYAQQYHYLYEMIKSSDKSAKIAVGGVTQPSPLRLLYLDHVLEHYETMFHRQLPADWWTVHGFVMREERDSWGADIPVGFPKIDEGQLYEITDVGRVDLFKKGIISFRTWMAERGYQDTPLAITEFSILLSDVHGYTPDFVANYLLVTFDWLDSARDTEIGYPRDDYHLVQRWAWFSLYDKLYYGSNLGHPGVGTVTEIGWAFRRFVQESMP